MRPVPISLYHSKATNQPRIIQPPHRGSYKSLLENNQAQAKSSQMTHNAWVLALEGIRTFLEGLFGAPDGLGMQVEPSRMGSGGKKEK